MDSLVKVERGVNDATDNESAERDSAEIDNENDDQDSQKSEEGIGISESGQNQVSAQPTKSQPKVKAKDGLRKGKWTVSCYFPVYLNVDVNLLQFNLTAGRREVHQQSH